MSAADRFARLPTAAKFLLILTAAILPIGLVLTWIGSSGIQQANDALRGRSEDQARAAARAIESLIARNALALRIAANGALAAGPSGACERAQRSLAIAPAVSHSFELADAQGEPICTTGAVGNTGDLPLVAPGDIRLHVAPNADSIAIRTGLAEGMATSVVPVRELREVALQSAPEIKALVLRESDRELLLINPPPGQSPLLTMSDWPVGSGQLSARIGLTIERITTLERLALLLPLLMWVTAALITWLLVTRLLIRPLRLLQRTISRYNPGEGALQLPRRLGPATEIQELGEAFARAGDRVSESEREMAGALEGQRRLVREVHHRVKNNLQVVASLLNIHGRSAETPDARAAYAGIGRRVGALSIVHRNHFAEMEENRGISLRPLIAELAAELRAGAPDAARGLTIDLDVDTMFTTQDVAVAVAFLVTEIVEFAMLYSPQDPMEIELRRTSELTARLTLSSPVLVPDGAGEPEKVQFERIVGGLAKQLRSTLDRKLGRYGVDLPVFPAT